MKKRVLWTLIVSFIAIFTAISIPILVIFLNKNNSIVNNDGGNQNQKPNDDKVESDYLKDNILNPYTNGEYSFATPGTKGDNSIILSVGQNNTQPSPGVPPSANLLKGILKNENDINQAKKTYSLVFEDNSGGTHLGTGWILDYKLPDENETYPKTWYIATNTHVIQNLKVKNDTISPERYYPREKDKNLNTKLLKMINLDQYKINEDLKDNLFLDNGYYKYADIYPESNNGQVNLKTVFIGNDFLKTTPSSYSKGLKWKDTEEYIDFSVMEVTFQSEQEAKKMTNDYYNNKEIHFKYKKESLVKNQSNIDNNTFNVLGYPALSKDPLNKASTLHVNKPLVDQSNAFSNGGRLATSPYYQTFKGIKSAFDAALGLSFFTFAYRHYDPNAEYPVGESFYNSWGLMYSVDYGNLGPGSSGSMLIDKNGFTWGIHFAIDDTSSIGLSQALYCEGFNYNGAFGDYNLEGYDIIEGGFPNQKKSYRDGLISLYGKTSKPYKTNLFPNGVNRN